MFSHHSAQIALHVECFAPFPNTLFDRTLSSPAWSTELRTMSRAEWVDQCMRRLSELRPDEDRLSLATLVGEIWLDLPGFHPVLAAEMEHECWD